MDEKTINAFKMQFIKGEWLVLEISGAELATIKTENEIDEDVFRRVMLFVKYLVLAGVILAVIGIIVSVTIPPYLGPDDEWVYPASGWMFFAVAAFMVSAFYGLIAAHNKNEQMIIAASKASGTIQVHHWSGTPITKPKVQTPAVSITDGARIEIQVERVTNDDGPDYDVTAMHVRDKDGHQTRVHGFSTSKPMGEIIQHANAWLAGKEAGPVTYRVLI